MTVTKRTRHSSTLYFSFVFSDKFIYSTGDTGPAGPHDSHVANIASFHVFVQGVLLGVGPPIAREIPGAYKCIVLIMVTCPMGVANAGISGGVGVSVNTL